MSYSFSRPWLNLDRVFRPTGQFSFPDRLLPGVQLTYDPLERLFTSGAQLRCERLTLALNAGANSQDLVEPSAGFVQYPVRLMVFQPDAGNTRTIELALLNTTSAPDPWGRYNTGAGMVMDATEVDGAIGWGKLSAPSIVRGNRLSVSWLAMTGGNSGHIDYFWVDVPGELLMLDDTAHTT
jgi:hypothetical protein